MEAAKIGASDDNVAREVDGHNEKLLPTVAIYGANASGKSNLLDAFEFIGELRIEHQAAQIRRGEKADNFLSPKQLSRLERAHLKDAFKVIQTMQESLSHRYHTGHIS